MPCRLLRHYAIAAIVFILIYAIILFRRRHADVAMRRRHAMPPLRAAFLCAFSMPIADFRFHCR